MARKSSRRTTSRRRRSYSAPARRRTTRRASTRRAPQQTVRLVIDQSPRVTGLEAIEAMLGGKSPGRAKF